MTHWNEALHVYFDKPERFKALWHLRDEIPRDELRKLFCSTWTISESHYQDMDIITALFERLREGESTQHWMMDDEDRSGFQKVKARSALIKIYRGCWRQNQEGWSWTTSKTTATIFANRHAPDGFPLVLSGRVMAENIIAYTNSRKEKEIIVRPENIQLLKMMMLPFKNPKAGSMIFQAVQAGNLWTREQEIERMVTFSLFNKEQSLGEIQRRLEFFDRYGFTDKVAFLQEVKHRVHAEVAA